MQPLIDRHLCDIDVVRLDSADLPVPAASLLDQDRLDAVRTISGRAPTPTGGLRLDAQITRSGIFEYRQPDGSVRREYRPPSEVQSPASLATLAACPVTIGHAALVTADNWGRVAKGHAAETHRIDGSWIHNPLYLQDSSTIKAVEANRLTGVSAGYKMDLVIGPGVTPEGQAYDAIQTNIRYNHIALIPPGTGRAGREASIRLDVDESYSQGEQIMDPKELLAALQIRYDALNGEAGALRAELAAAKAALTTTTATADAATAALTAARADSSDAAIDARVASRSALCDVARSYLGATAVFAGKSDNQVRLDCLTKIDPKLSLVGKDEAYVTAYFDATVAARGASATAAARAATTPTGAAVRTDATDPAPSKVYDWSKAYEDPIAIAAVSGKH